METLELQDAGRAAAARAEEVMLLRDETSAHIADLRKMAVMHPHIQYAARRAGELEPQPLPDFASARTARLEDLKYYARTGSPFAAAKLSELGADL